MEPMVDILILICVYSFFATLSIIPLFCMSIIMAPVNSNEFVLFISSCIVSYFFCYFIEISRKWAEKYYEKHGLTSIERCRMDVLILSGIVGFLTALPRIVMFFEGTEQLIFCYATLICVPAFCSCLYQYFAFQTKTNINLYKQRYLIAVWLVFHAFLLTVNLYKMRESSLPDNLKGLHEVCQLAFSVLSAVGSLEFVMAWRGAVESNDAGEQYRIVTMVNEEVEVEEVVYENEPSLNRYSRENQFILLKKDKINLLVGFGGIIICTIIPRVAAFFVDENTLWGISIVTILCILLTTVIFTFSRKTISELNYNDHPSTILWLVGIHAFIFNISLSMVSSNEDLVSKVFITQTIFGFNSLSSTIDFIVIWNDDFYFQAPHAPREAPTRTETSRYSLTNFSVITHGCLGILTLIFGGSRYGLLILIVGCLVFGGVDMLAESLRQKSIKIYMLIGLGAMGMLGFVPRIVHGVLIEANTSNLLLSMIFTLSLTLSFYFHFIYGHRSPTFHFQYEAHESIIAKFAVIHSIILIAMIRISYGHWENEEFEVIVFSQFAFFLLPLTSSIDFWMVWNDAVVLEDDVTEVVTVRKPTVVEKRAVKLRPPKVTCFSCHQGYNEKNMTPRILKECGHTICEKCANNRLAENHLRHLFCPKCRKVTVVKGAANTLTKNYLVLELMEKANSM
ncbi:hypothetical protein CAEBREN_07335 [Caenorhabditis brenneri]|uniref:RING-type domain-containing protein n=1 Tax=Caenorhabditis brenneri TaxID=135651 RepID=G0MWY3_CAEBE|nr:hypothetical protein CAEBREN_07335 [Caenorhabditis brenneri]